MLILFIIIPVYIQCKICIEHGFIIFFWKIIKLCYQNIIIIINITILIYLYFSHDI